MTRRRGSGPFPPHSLSDRVLVSFDNDGEPYICAEPVRYITLPGSTIQRVAPVRMTVAEYAELRRRLGLPLGIKLRKPDNASR